MKNTTKKIDENPTDLFPAIFSNYFGIEISDNDATLVFGHKREDKIISHTRVALTKKGLGVLNKLITDGLKKKIK
ncbi:MAG TPA: hypothetical protein ENI23_03365 [bacterium]|nr:hypothetical protein [bacterium]